MEKNDQEPDDGMTVIASGHLKITDVTTGEVLVNQRDNLVHQRETLKGYKTDE